MPLDKTTLVTALETAFGAPNATDPASKTKIEQMAANVADAIDLFVKSGTVTISSNGLTGVGPPGGPLPIVALPGTGTVT